MSTSRSPHAQAPLGQLSAAQPGRPTRCPTTGSCPPRWSLPSWLRKWHTPVPGACSCSSQCSPRFGDARHERLLCVTGQRPCVAASQHSLPTFSRQVCSCSAPGPSPASVPLPRAAWMLHGCFHCRLWKLRGTGWPPCADLAGYARSLSQWGLPGLCTPVRGLVERRGGGRGGKPQDCSVLPRQGEAGSVRSHGHEGEREEEMLVECPLAGTV